MERPEVLQGVRMLFDRHKMQPPAAARVAPPSLPGGEEVEAEAEAGLEDDEALAAGPPLGKLVTLQEDMPGLLEAPGGAVVDVAECFGIWNSVPERQAGGDEQLGHALLCGQGGFAMKSHVLLLALTTCL